MNNQHKNKGITMSAKKSTGCTFLIVLLFAFLANVFAAGFTDNHNDNTLTGWTSAAPRTWAESNGSVKPDEGNANNGLLINNYACANNGSLEVTMTTDQWNGFKGGVLFRYASPTSYYFLSILPGNQYNNYLKFCKNTLDASAGVTVASNFVMNSTFTLKIELNGSTFKFYIDNVLRGQITDTSITSGKVGYGYAPDWNSYTSYDNIIWTDEAASTYQLTVATIGNGTVSPASGTYNAGQTVTITATPANGYRFDHWTGDLTDSVNPATVVMNSNIAITAHFSQIITYTLRVDSDSTGTVSPRSGTYNPGQSVVITATPAAGFRFSHWSGDLTDTVNPATVVMNSNKVIAAHFSQIITYTLRVDSDSTGTVSPRSGTYNPGQSVVITATPAAGYRFSYWSGDLTDSVNPATVVMNSNKVIAAHFSQIITYTLRVDSDSTGTVSPRSGTYNPGQSVVITATPAAGYRFSYWSGDLTDTVNPATVVMNSNKVIAAHFSQIITYTLRVDSDSTGTVSPRSGTYNPGQSVVITATPAAGYRFSYWSGDLTDSVNPATVVMNSNKVIAAHFSQIITYTLRVDSDSTGTVSPRSGTYNPGQSVVITATPAAGYRFSYWSGDLTDTVNPATVVMNSNKVIAAHFSQIITYTLRVDSDSTGTVSPRSGTYNPGQSVVITATPAAGYIFSHWSGDLTDSVNPATVVMNGNKVITAHFSQNTRNVPNSEKLSISAKLFDENGIPVGNSSVVYSNVVVKFFDNADSGTVKYTENFLSIDALAVPIEKGNFVVRLGEGVTADDLKQVLAEYNNLWVELQVDSETIKRVPLTSAAYLISSNL